MSVTRDVESGQPPAVLDSLLAGYRPEPGIFDEMIAADGSVRPHWAPILARVSTMGLAETKARFDVADRYLRDSGVFYRVYDPTSPGERPWPLSHVPLLISPSEWAEIRAGVVQRARLAEAVLKDCYGPASLLAKRALPAAVVAGNPEFLRPMVGAKPVGGRHLTLYAVDLGRAPNGRWWVLGDRTQAPSGAGYALENRIALSRALPESYREFAVERLADFFQAFRTSLSAFLEPEDAGVCLLTPGPLNESYFEHVYLSRYLGFRLVEGQDLTVRNQRVHLRTISGLQRVNALWRRVDADFADPLELNGRSELGVPGLVQAIRQGNVALANALGSGLIEARAFMSFMPSLAEELLGEPLTMPNVATWWCGQQEERDFVRERFDKLVIAPAFGLRLPGVLSPGPRVVAELPDKDRAALEQAIESRAIDYVGQEVVHLSTTPVWTGERLEPRPFVLRVFAAVTEDGWTVMPGGLALIGDRIDARAVTMQAGARSADVWVLSEGPVSDSTLLPLPKEVPVRRPSGALPSRTADNLFWFARYLERAECTVRLVRALAGRLTEGGTPDRGEISALIDILFQWGAVRDRLAANGTTLTAAALFGRNAKGSVSALVQLSRDAGFVTRDRLPPDAWRALQDLHSLVQAAPSDLPSEGFVLEKANAALRLIAAVSGFEMETMNRQASWRFLDLGRRIERAIATCRFTRRLAGEEASSDSLDVLLELTDSQITYRSRYLLGAANAPVLDLVLYDDGNPRSLAYQFARIEEHVAALPRLSWERQPSQGPGLVADLAAELKDAETDGIDNTRLIGIENQLMRLSNEIARSYFTFRDPVGGEAARP